MGEMAELNGFETEFGTKGAEFWCGPEWNLNLKAQSHRHPGAGRDPELPMVVSFLDSGLRRNDD
jgi:hypothetical protein